MCSDISNARYRHCAVFLHNFVMIVNFDFHFMLRKYNFFEFRIVNDFDNNSAHVISMYICNNAFAFNEANVNCILACPMNRTSYRSNFPNSVLVYSAKAMLSNVILKLLKDIKTLFGLDLALHHEDIDSSIITSIDKSFFVNIITFALLAHLLKSDGRTVIYVDNRIGVGKPHRPITEIPKIKEHSNNVETTVQLWDVCLVDSCVIDHKGTATVNLRNILCRMTRLAADSFDLISCIDNENGCDAIGNKM